MIAYLPSRTSSHYHNTNTTNGIGSNNEKGVTYGKQVNIPNLIY